MSAWITGPIKHGATTGIGTTAKSLVAGDTVRLNRGLLIKSLRSNTDTIYVGSSSVTASNGMPIEPGESLSIETLTCGDTYVLAASGTQEVRFIGA